MALSKYGRYETLHRIASGGMASVYLGRHLGAGGFERLVAIKVMHEHIADDPAFSAMFLDEARLAAQIRHPNVVPTLDVADDGRYIVMEYVEGASLQAILRARRKAPQEPIPLPIALRIFLDALAGLHAAHELSDTKGKPLNLVHRDISPHNVLVGVDGMSRITDFGIAYAEARLTSTKSGQLKGKLPYMSPEQLEDVATTRTTDVYAAGCVLWEVLAGQRLFRGQSEAAVACAVLAGPERTIRDVRPDIPAEIDEACMRALTREGERYETALAFAEAVERAAEEAGVVLAKHREVGPVAALDEMTFPPASTLGDSDDDPRPPELMAQLSASNTAVPVTPVTVVAEPPSERDVATAVRDAARTLPSDDGSAGNMTGRTTTEDRPPPEVAAVIRRAQQEHARDDAPPSSASVDYDDLSVVIPKDRSYGSLLAAATVTVGLAAGVIWMATRGGEEAQFATPRPAASNAAASDAAASNTAAKLPTKRRDTPPSSQPVVVGTVSAAPSAHDLPPAPWTARPGSLSASPTPPPPAPSPTAAGGEYHPHDP